MRSALQVLVVAALAVALAGTACRKTQETAPPPGKAAATPAQVGAPAAAPADDMKMLALVPGTAAAVLVIEAPAVALEWAPALLGIAAGSAEAKAMWADVSAVLKRRTGLDVAKIGPVVAFVDIPRKAAAALLLGVNGADLRVPTGGEHKGTKIYDLSAIDSELVAAQLGDGLALGTEAGVKALIDVSKGDEKAASDAPTAAALRDTLTQVGGGQIRFAIDVAATGLPIQEELELPRLATVGAGLTAGAGAAQSLRVVATGTKDDIATVETLIRTTREKATAQIAEERKKAEQGDSTAGELGLAVAQHAWSAAERSLSVENEGTTLKLGIKTDAVQMMLVPVLAAVAVPAFLKYSRRAQTTEAIDGLDKALKGAAYYGTSPRIDATGARLPCAFPPSTDFTPPGSPCDYPDGMYPATAGDWANPTWSALNFQITAPHRFRYRFESSGTGSDAKFTITASSDLDCDGVWSTFSRSGQLEETDGECSMMGTSAFFVDNETE